MIKIKEKLFEGWTFIDLFAGLGGFRLALESLGGRCVYSNEWDKDAKQVYYKNFNEIPDDDITKVDEKQVPEHDILCAGFPCQPFSISGKKRGFEDTRGTLFFDIARIVKEKKPKIVFMENVKNFASHDNGRTLNTIMNTMSELGYDFYYKVLNAADYGIPQKRERIYMVCFRKDLNIIDFDFPKGIKLEKHVCDYLLEPSNETEKLIVQRDDEVMSKDNLDDTFSDKTVRLGIVGKGGQGERIYSTKGIAITLSANGGGVYAKTGGYLINGKVRRLHPRECARLMGYPDSYILSDSLNQSYVRLGNSVVIDVLQYIAIEMGKAIKK